MEKRGKQVPNLDGYISIKEAAKMLQLSYKTVNQYVNEGRIPSLKAAHAYLIHIDRKSVV